MVSLLSVSQQLPRRPQRILVAGTSGSGKTTLAQQISHVSGIPCIEIDGLYHGPGWVPRASFMDDVRALVAQPCWVTEWQYSAARPLLLARADLMVWLDLPRALVMRQVIGRTLRRRWAGVELWNGNVEPPLRAIITDPRAHHSMGLADSCQDRATGERAAGGRSRLPGGTAAWSQRFAPLAQRPAARFLHSLIGKFDLSGGREPAPWGGTRGRAQRDGIAPCR